MTHTSSKAIRSSVSSVISFLALALVAGCHSPPSGGELPGAGLDPTAVAGTTPPAPAPAPAPVTGVGESCQSDDPNKLCLAVHWVAYKNSSGQPVASTAQAATIIHKMNELWGKCGIGFQIGKYEEVDPAASNLAFGEQAQSETDQIRRAFDSPSNELLAVTTGPWGTAVNAWTAMPGEGVYGAVMESSIVTYGEGIIYAHEFGHYLGLDHASDSSNLMSPVIYDSSTDISSGQCQEARSVVESSWPAMLRR